MTHGQTTRASKLDAAALQALVKPIAQAKYEVDVPWHLLERSLSGLAHDYGMLELEPDFQRGHVWDPDQQQHFIENVMRGVVTTAGMTIQLNCPHFDALSKKERLIDLPEGVQCIDGLQRLTAVRKFMAREVRAFGLSVEDLAGTEFAPNRMTYARVRLAIFSFKRKAELLDHYLALNAGGTPHSESEIARVRAMRAALADGA